MSSVNNQPYHHYHHHSCPLLVKKNERLRGGMLEKAVLIDKLFQICNMGCKVLKETHF